MIKNIFILTLVLSLASCKKDRICKCAVVINYTAGGTVYQTNQQNITITYKNVNKRVAKKNCVNASLKYNSSQDYTTQDCKIQ